MRLAQLEGIISERVNLAPAPLYRRKLAVYIVEIEILLVKQSLEIGSDVNAIAFISVEAVNSYDWKTAASLLRSVKFINVAKVAWKRYNIFWCYQNCWKYIQLSLE